MAGLTESTVELADLAGLESTGWRIVSGPDIAPDMPAAVRTNCDNVGNYRANFQAPGPTR